MSALELVNTTTISSGVSSVNVTSVFTADYEVYKVVGANFLGATSTATGTNLRLINSSSSVITDDYMYAQLTMKGETSFGENRSEDEDRIWNVFSGIDDSGQASGGCFWIFNPFAQVIILGFYMKAQASLVEILGDTKELQLIQIILQ